MTEKGQKESEDSENRAYSSAYYHRNGIRAWAAIPVLILLRVLLLLILLRVLLLRILLSVRVVLLGILLSVWIVLLRVLLSVRILLLWILLPVRVILLRVLLSVRIVLVVRHLLRYPSPFLVRMSRSKTVSISASFLGLRRNQLRVNISFITLSVNSFRHSTLKTPVLNGRISYGLRHN